MQPFCSSVLPFLCNGGKLRVDILFNVISFSFVNEIVIYSGWLLQKRQRVRYIRNEEPRRLLFCRGRGDRKRDLFFFLFL